MTGTLPASRLALLRRIARFARTPADKQFLHAYLCGVEETDLAAASPAARASLALQHLATARRRQPGEILLKVWNPPADDARDGSPHTRILLVMDDMPFLVDSLSIVLRDAGTIHLLVHPVLAVRRDRRGRLLQVSAAPLEGGRAESWQLYEVDRELDAERLQQLEHQLRRTLEDVTAAVTDWRRMHAMASELATTLGEGHPEGLNGEVREGRELLAWMAADHFTFLGYRYHRLERGPTTDRLVAEAGTGLGVLRDKPSAHDRPEGTRGTVLAGAQRTLARSLEPLFVTKANRLSTVHRATYLDYVGAKQFDNRGKVVGEHRFLGLWTSGIYREPTREIPVLRHKVARVMAALGLGSDGHDAKAVHHVLETYPRDELFQSSVAELVETVRGTVNLYERRQVRLFPRRDPFGRFWSCLLYVPRDRYNTQAREFIELIVLAAYGGTAIETQVQLGESSLARLHLRIRTPAATAAPPAVNEVEQRITDALRTWTDRLRAALLRQHPESHALTLAARYGNAFPLAYQEDSTAANAVEDIAALEAAQASPGQWQWRPYRLVTDSPGTLRLKLFRSGKPMAVADMLPLFESLGLKLLSERPYGLRQLTPACWIQDFELQPRSGGELSLATDAPRLLAALTAMAEGRAETDGFNRLVLRAALEWRDVVVLRAYAKWLLQTGLPFSQNYMEQVLEQRAALAAQLVALFSAQFDPTLPPATREHDASRALAAIETGLAGITRLDEDRILRGFRDAIVHTLRTNHHQRTADGQPKAWLSFKLDAANLPDLPLPRPQFEIFVYSPRVEGVHLRKGLVARGGLRWSDRREDFRTEVLGLMKAQNVKNTVIVPVGAKGGFYCKQLPTEREAMQREGIACYQTFIRGLLDLTDNRVDGRIVPPPRVIRRDGDDPYLVVAADKGTATFSDIANAISLEYGHWLGDAFASGGSVGYDHKKMAITARGAWESVKRHFRELDLDTQTTPFTCAGIGDMAGDVFGNGMLQSPQLRLVAAFNHQHIFLDPLADAARGYAERSRLFALPRSTWDDYDRRALGTGGGIHLRSAKALALSPEAQTLLGLPASAAPNDVIRAILRLPVDLLWNGGIGTYVKAARETHLEVGDRANDAVRINGQELRARVVGEGGNLGMTQLGRVEYALHGGRLNTDFIDNSAGVNCSDVEVNTKVLLGMALERNLLRAGQRNALLARMTDEVATLVLRNNILQGQALSVLVAESRSRGHEHAAFIRALERSGDLDRAIEFLPNDDELQERLRGGQGLTRPELAVVLSYAKIWLNQHLLASSIPEDPWLAHELERYFPSPLRRRYGELAKEHPLRREIIATAITNTLVNRSGPAFALRLAGDTGATVPEVARGWAVAHAALQLESLWPAIEALDGRVSTAVQTDLLLAVARQLRHATHWVITQRRHLGDIDSAAAALRPGLAAFWQAAPGALSAAAAERHAARVARYATAGVPPALANRVALLELTLPALQVATLAANTGTAVSEATTLYLEVGNALGLDWLQAQVEALQVEGRWPALARTSLRDELHDRQLAFAAAALSGPGKSPTEQFANWRQRHATGLAGLQQTLTSLQATSPVDFATLSVALQAVRRVV